MKKPRRWPELLVLGILGSGALLGAAVSKAPGLSEKEAVRKAAAVATLMFEWLPDSFDREELVYSGIQAMLEQLDPHSYFMDPKSFARTRQRHEGSFYGVGIIVSKRAGKVTVIAPIAGTPAARKGLRAGDVIVAVDGKETEGMNMDEVVDNIRGPEGTEVTLTIARPGIEKPFDVTITRGKISPHSVQYAFLIRPTIGYVKLSEFNENTPWELDDALLELERSGAQALLLDLRNNPGGTLRAAVMVASLFLKPGDLVVSIKGRAVPEQKHYASEETAAVFEGPLVVLVNSGSASASEIVAGAVQDHDRGLIVGERTWGKGLVQTVYPVADAGLALTTARYYTPSGRCIQRPYESFIDYYAMKNGEEPEGEPFKTEHGRTVYGGGGIRPDIVIKMPEPEEAVVKLRSQSAFFRFAVVELEHAEGEERKELARKLAQQDDLVDRFIAFVRKEKLLEEDMLAELSKPELRGELRRLAASEILNSGVSLEEGYRISVEGDVQVQKALEAIPKAEELMKIWLEVPNADSGNTD